MKVWNHWCKLRDRLREGVAGVTRRKSERQRKREKVRKMRGGGGTCVCARPCVRVCDLFFHHIYILIVQNQLYAKKRLNLTE